MQPELPALGPVRHVLLGTPVHELPVDGEGEVTIVSDLHLSPAESAAMEAFRAFLNELPDGALALVLGDLFDYWVGRPQLRQATWRGVPDALAAAARRGVRLFVLHGNRDYQLERSFEVRTGARVVPGGLLLRSRGNRDLLCLHGDELCQNDVAYQRWKRLLRSRPVRFALHRMPFAVSRRLAGHARAVSKRSIARADQAKLRPSTAAIARIRRLGAPDLVFGHIHVAARGDVPGGGEPLAFYVLPSFDAEARGHAKWTPGATPRLLLRGIETEWPTPCALGP